MSDEDFGGVTADTPDVECVDEDFDGVIGVGVGAATTAAVTGVVVDAASTFLGDLVGDDVCLVAGLDVSTMGCGGVSVRGGCFCSLDAGFSSLDNDVDDSELNKKNRLVFLIDFFHQVKRVNYLN